MNTIWLKSKVKVPSVAKTAINRERLQQLIKEGDSTKLTIIQAPAGYGKTTILSQWISQLKEHSSWLSIDSIDNDPIRFWKYVIQSISDTLNNNDLDLRLSSLFTTYPHSPFELIIDSLLNELGSQKRKIHIVLDDYHLIKHPIIHEMMIRFIDYLPNNIRVYILSRTRLPFPLARWRVKSWLTEIGITQLCFTYVEIEHLYKQKKLELNDEQRYQDILDKTEGWAAGIQLVGLAIAGDELHVKRFDGTHPFVADFLIKEIFETLPVTTQHFLLQTAVLNTLEPNICNSLTNRSDSYDVLVELVEKGIFTVRMSSFSSIFRYHQLFAEVLQSEMKNYFNEEQVKAIYKKAGNLLCGKGDYISAIELVLQQQIYDLANSWITTYLVDIFETGQITTFIRWVDLLRNDKYPLPFETIVMYTIALTSVSDLQKAKQIFDELEQRHTVDQWMDHPDHQGIVSILTTFKAYVLLAIGDDKEQVGQIIITQLQKGRVSSRWDHIPMQYNQFEPKLSRTLIGSKGKFTPINEAIAFAEFFHQTEFKEQNMMGFSYGVLAETMYEANLLDEALQTIEEGLQYAYRFQDSSLSIPLYILKSRIYMAKRQFPAAQAMLNHAIQSVTEWYWIRSLQAMKAHCFLIEHDIKNAETELFKTKRPDILKIELGQEFWLLVYARFLIATNDVQEALNIIIHVKEKAANEEQISTIIEASLLEARCHLKVDAKELAFSSLHKALELGFAFGYKRSFIDEEDTILLIRKYITFRQGESKQNLASVPLSYVNSILKTTQNFAEETKKEILTPREIDVLQLLASGASNREIASQLFLSEGTIRVYLTNIYSKLEVQSRTQAIILAKEWNF